MSFRINRKFYFHYILKLFLSLKCVHPNLIYLCLTVAEAVPVQNQAAAQKLLQKMSQPPPRGGHRSRGRGHRGRDREEDESHLLTLEEWERRKTGANVSAARNFPDVSQDEDLARQLQHQLDFEDFHVSNYGFQYSNDSGTLTYIFTLSICNLKI